MQLCVAHGEKEEVDQAWGALVRRTTALEGMRSNLIMESSRWAKANQRLKAINTLSLTLITQACETYLIQNSRPEMVTDDYRELFAEPVETVQDVHQQLKRMRRFLTRKASIIPRSRFIAGWAPPRVTCCLSAAWWGILKSAVSRMACCAAKRWLKWNPPNVITRW